jgi:DNA (cytosine-5)-methyltransferase 1
MPASAANGSNPQPGNPCHPLAAGAKAPAIAFPANLSGTQCASTEELAPAMGAANPTAVAVPVHAIQAGALRTNPLSGPDGIGVQADHAYTLEARAEVQAVQSAMQVRRLTPEECEALQGFQRGYTRIPNWNGWRDMDMGEHPDDLRAQGLKVKQSKTGKWRVNDPDGPRYKALGNSWAVPNVNWLGQRIAAAIGAAQRVEETSEGA